jgi:FixJ family two-component response regulator
MPIITFSRPDTKMAVEAMKLGATDYLEKPLTSDAFNDVISRYKKKIGLCT